MKRPDGVGADTYRSLFDNMPQALAYCRMVLDKGEPRDWIFVDVNDAFEALIGASDVIGRRVSELLPGFGKSDAELFEVCARVAASGKAEQLETYVNALEMWLALSIYSPQKDHFVAVVDAIAGRKAAEQALRHSEERFRAIFERAAVGISLTAPDGRWLRVNPRMCAMLGYREEELIGQTYKLVTLPEDVDRQQVHDSRLRAGLTESFIMEKRYVRRDGAIIWGKVSASLVRKPSGEPHYSIAVVEDITAIKQAALDKERLQAQLLQAQKMESVGRLAGGVAHDFNNMLQIITSYADMAAAEVDPTLLLHQQVEQIRSAAGRAADLTRQLLAFARKQAASPRMLDLNDTISGTTKMLARLIGEDIDLAWLPARDLWRVRVDPAQVDQILANLCVNARDAIRGIGHITIETGNVTLDGRFCAARAGFIPGEYVLVAVNDDGAGMDKEVIDHLFEPYFTTKGAGEGTGLGLSTVYGIVKQNGGFVDVSSEPGKGTSFAIYLPRVAGSDAEMRSAAPAAIPKGRGETVLLVEDDPAILEAARRMLEHLGYSVLGAGTPALAVELAQSASTIDLLVTDVVMPLMNGRDVAAQVCEIRPSSKVLFVSGYTEDVIAHRGILDEGVHFLQKPFSLQDLGTTVRKILDSK